MKVYGIKNCDTVKKVLKKLDSKKIEYTFIDFKKEPPTIELLDRWKKKIKDYPINPRGRTFKMIKEEYDKTSNEAKKAQLLCTNSSALKRPIIEYKNKLIIGNDEEFLNSL